MWHSKIRYQIYFFKRFIFCYIISIAIKDKPYHISDIRTCIYVEKEWVLIYVYNIVISFYCSRFFFISTFSMSSSKTCIISYTHSQFIATHKSGVILWNHALQYACRHIKYFVENYGVVRRIFDIFSLSWWLSLLTEAFWTKPVWISQSHTSQKQKH